MAKTYGMDLGTANTLICHKGEIILRAPSVVAINNDDREIVALGPNAKNMLGKTPSGITAFRPLKGGVIAEYELTEQLLRRCLSKVCSARITKPCVAISVAAKVTEVS